MGKLAVDAELILTKPVKIMHPTESILLPYVQGTGQLWHTYATGGSGVYTWFVEDTDVVQVEGSVVLRSLRVGKTHLVV